MKLAIIAITKNGSALANRLASAYHEGADLYIPARFITPEDGGARALGDDLASDAARLFGEYTGLAFIMATGIVVRLIAPHLKDKLTDPAVVVLDEKGEYVISLLSGHAGGANALACKIAGLIGAEPVITTASDVEGRLAVDTLAGMLDCAVEDATQAKRVTAAIVNEERVSIYSHIDLCVLAGRLGKKPANLRVYHDVLGVIGSEHDAAILITPRVLPDETMKSLEPVAVLRPKVLVVGIGCNRGTSSEEIEGLFDETLKEGRLSPLSVRNIATIEDKRDEAGLVEFAKKRNLKVEYFSKEDLSKADTPSGASETVFKNMGVYGVCEPAALLSAGARTLLVAKRKSENATTAVAEAALP
jgi:cobalt-precorrin 5A hydrolase